jgi:hypothetical protein
MIRGNATLHIQDLTRAFLNFESGEVVPEGNHQLYSGVDGYGRRFNEGPYVDELPS